MSIMNGSWTIRTLSEPVRHCKMLTISSQCFLAFLTDGRAASRITNALPPDAKIEGVFLEFDGRNVRLRISSASYPEVPFGNRFPDVDPISFGPAGNPEPLGKSFPSEHASSEPWPDRSSFGVWLPDYTFDQKEAPAEPEPESYMKRPKML